MKELILMIQSESGLHARPASLLVVAAQKFRSTIEIEKEGRKINAKSIMSILSLGGAKGDEVKVYINGEDEESAAYEMVRFFNETILQA